jgi:hypothetical protein
VRPAIFSSMLAGLKLSAFSWPRGAGCYGRRCIWLSVEPSIRAGAESYRRRDAWCRPHRPWLFFQPCAQWRRSLWPSTAGPELQRAPRPFAIEAVKSAWPLRLPTPPHSVKTAPSWSASRGRSAGNSIAHRPGHFPKIPNMRLRRFGWPGGRQKGRERNLLPHIGLRGAPVLSMRGLLA